MNDAYQRGVFPSIAAEQVILSAVSLAPADVSLSRFAPGDPLRASAADCCAFIRALYDDMLADPDVYDLRPGAFEALLAGGKRHGALRRDPKRYDALRGYTINAPHAYVRLLFALAAAGEADADALRLSPEAWRSVHARFDAASRKKTMYNLIGIDRQRAALARVGLTIDETPDGAVVRASRYPGMFPGLAALARSVANTKTFGEFNAARFDFRQLSGSCTPDYGDYTRFLPQERRDALDALDEFAKARGAKRSVVTFWKVNYVYKSRHVMTLDVTTDFNALQAPRAFVWCRARAVGGERDAYLSAVAGEDEEFRRAFRRRLNYCTACSSSHLGAFADVFGRRVRLCEGGTPAVRVYDPGADDLPFLRRAIDLRIDMIERERAEKKAKD